MPKPGIAAPVSLMQHQRSRSLLDVWEDSLRRLPNHGWEAQSLDAIRVFNGEADRIKRQEVVWRHLLCCTHEENNFFACSGQLGPGLLYKAPRCQCPSSGAAAGRTGLPAGAALEGIGGSLRSDRARYLPTEVFIPLVPVPLRL